MRQEKLSLALPKGRMFDNVIRLLEDSGLGIEGFGRNYRPVCSDPRFEVKVLKPQNIVQMVELGSHDIAFAGHDWVVEQRANVRELLDTGLDPVRVVVAAPQAMADWSRLRSRRIIVASEYENISRTFLDSQNMDYVFVRSYGATEVFPPEDADLIVDNTASGRTLKENGLVEMKSILTSSTRLIANPASYQGEKGRIIDALLTLLRSVLDARTRVMLEMNIDPNHLDDLLGVLPCMRRPTVSPLAAEDGFAVKAAVEKKAVPALIPILKSAGATDILEYPFSRVVL